MTKTDIAKSMIERIKEKAAAGDLDQKAFAVVSAPSMSRIPADVRARFQTAIIDEVTVAGTDGSTLAERTAYPIQADAMFTALYGVSYDSVASLFVPKGDLARKNAEEGVPVLEFVTTLGSQFALTPVDGFDAEVARYTAGENRNKVSLQEFCFQQEGWTFSDGYAVKAADHGATVIAPNYDESHPGWQYAGYTVPCEKEAFLAMSAGEKAAVPAESRLYGDVGECASVVPALDAAPRARAM